MSASSSAEAHLVPSATQDDAALEHRSEPHRARRFRFRWTVTAKLTGLIVTLTALGFSALLVLASYDERRALTNMAVQNYTAMAGLLSEQLSGAIRWDNAEQVKATFDKASLGADASLRALSAYGVPGAEATFSASFATEQFADAQAQTVLADAGNSAPDEVMVNNTDGHVVIVTPVISAKDGTRVGTIATAWDTQGITATTNTATLHLALLTIGTLAVLAIVLSLVISHTIGKRIRAGVAIAKRIAEGHLDNHIEVRSKDELGQLARALNDVQTSLIAGDDSQRRAAEFGRIKQALDFTRQGTLLVDEEHTIVYANQAVQRLFEENTAMFRKVNKDTLVGAGIDVFDEFPELRRSAIDSTHSARTVELTENDRTVVVTITPVVSTEDERRIGTVFEWLDRTREVTAERAVQSLVDAAARGDFSCRIDVSSMRGFHAQVGEMLNKLAEISEVGLNDTLRVLEALADGQLTEKIEADYEGVFGALKRSCNTTSNKLMDIVGRIRDAAEQVSRGAGEISQGNADLSKRTEQQAASLEETAAAMDEMNITVRQNADNAHRASDLADSARNEAQRGGEVARQAVIAVGEISASSKRIADIIGVIDDIAFQTNLLALNASVEAARAGEQGRGFAVVASEVRNLAGRSATAAKEIKELIDDSGAKVSEGEKLVRDSGDALTTIVDSVQTVSDIVSEIATASVEQTEGIGQINKAVTQIDEMTQRNAALVEEAAASSLVVGEQAHQLDELVKFFSTGGRATVELERRGTDRAWSQSPVSPDTPARAAPTTAPAKPRVVAVAASSDIDESWEEF